MRKIFVIAALVGAMFIVDYFQTENVAGFALAAIGFVILASYTIADLGSSALKLPKVTGYIIAGILLGPYVFNILSGEVVEELKMFNTLALGLIALNAGLELSIDGIKRIARILFSTIAFKLALLPVFVGGTVYTLASYFPQMLGAALDPVHITCLALLFSAFAIGTSPAISIAVSNEMNSKGRSTELILGSAIFKDLVVVVTLAIVIAVCKPILDSASEFNVQSLMYVVEKLGFSLLIGLGFGFAIIVYVRYFSFQMLLFIFCLILAAAEIAQVLHGDLLLVFICAGFIVRNFSKYEHDVLEPMNLVSLPTFVIFFTIAGAAINLQRTLTLIGFTLSIVAARILAFYLASYFAARLNKEPPVIRNKLWLGYISQAGVTLGLVGLAANQLPVLSGWILDLGVAFVAINLLLGPIGLRFAISHEAQIEKNEGESEVDSQQQAGAQDQKMFENSDLTDQVLAKAIFDFKEKLNQSFCKSIDRFSENYRNTIESSLFSSLDDKISDHKRAENLVSWTQLYSQKTFKSSHEIIEAFLAEMESAMLELPIEYKGTIAPDNIKRKANDSFLKRMRKTSFQISRMFQPKDLKYQRLVPVRAIMRSHIDLSMTDYAISLQENFLQLKFSIFEQILKLCRLELDNTTFMSEVDRILDYFRRLVEDDFRLTLERQFVNASISLEKFGTPESSAKEFSTAAEREPKRKRLLDQLLERRDEIKEVYSVFVEQITLVAMKAQISLRLDNIVRSTFIEGLQAVAGRYSDIMLSVNAKMSEILHQLSVDVNNKTEIEDVVAELLVQVEKLKFDELSKLTKKFQMDTSTHRASLQFKKIASLSTNRFRVLGPQSVTSDGFNLSSWSAQKVDFNDILREHLISDFSLTLDNRVSGFKDHLENLTELYEQIKEIFDFDEIMNNEDFETQIDSDLKTYLVNSIKISTSRILEANESLRTLENDIAKLLAESFNATLRKIDNDLESKPFTRTAINQVGRWQKQIDELMLRYEDQVFVRTPLRFFASLTKTWSRLRQIGTNIEFGSALEDEAVVINQQFEDLATKNSQKFREVEQQNPLFKKGFTLEPLRDRKYFNLNREHLDHLVKQYKLWQEQGHFSTSLVVGSSGTGKSSLLNVFQNSIADDKLIRLDGGNGLQRGKLFKRLALELECLPTLRDIVQALRTRPSVIVVDDFEQWFPIDAKSLISISNTLNLIQSTRNHCLWIVATNRMFFNFYKQSQRMQLCFHSVVELRALTVNQLKSLLESRLNYTGLELQPTRIRVRFFKGGLIINGSERIFYRALGRVSEGRMYQAISLWLHSLLIIDQKSVSASIQKLFELGPQHLGHLSALQLNLLIMMYRHGPLSQVEMIRAMDISGMNLSREISALKNHRYIETVNRKKQVFQLRKPVAQLLLGTIGEG